ncbi:MAG: hypothetical protein CVV64_09860 [Candidatus Wallbacteria bacterium HGW-Wallbacteria-1]|uniref:histidine kinase n=1 Tax=Candidatus Wallbacteria bacterium HGW-Wallbacteria-1 TaxID=2013854 RepID=A0A2N1PPQ4_9BACT|nr:MAG: hypothetical protein CVV64_09860 [Candidatus Wallbacteria bacterium HGW-Wallbacteria-1]
MRKTSAKKIIRQSGKKSLQSRKARLIFDNLMAHVIRTPGMGAVKDGNGRYLLINETFESRASIKGKDWYGKNDRQIGFFPESAVLAMENADRMASTCLRPVEILLEIPKYPEPLFILGMTIPVVDPFGNSTMLIFFGMDISEEWRLKSRLSESETRYQSLFDNASVGMILKNSQNIVLTANPKACEILGYSRGELKNMNMCNIMIHDEPHQNNHETPDSFSTGDSERIYIRKNRTRVWVDEKSNPVRSVNDPDSDEILELIMFSDITEQYVARTELALSDHILHELPEAIVVLDERGLIERWMGAAEEMFGYTSSEAVGSELNLILPDDQNRALEIMNQSLTDFGFFKGDLIGTNKSGEDLTLEVSFRQTRQDSKNDKGTVGILHDATTRRLLEEQARRGEVFESLGLLAGGVAHDLNNRLGPLVAIPELLLEEIDSDSALANDLKVIIEAAHDIAHEVRDLLSITRRIHIELEPLHPEESLNRFLNGEVFRQLLKSKPECSLATSIQNDLPQIMGSNQHLNKIYLNLISNAVEALNKGGTLFVKAETATINTPLFGHDTIRPGDYVVISIADTGEGIDEKHLPRIFEPFYTRKKMGIKSGSGLGLSIVYGLIKDHKAFLDVSSRPGLTTFTLYFPALKSNHYRKGSPTRINLKEMGKSRKGTETILILDDDHGQRNLAARALNKLGYSIHQAASAQEGLAILDDQNIDLVLLDMVLGDDEPDGLDFYREAIKTKPHLKAVVASGYSENDRVQEVLNLSEGIFLGKPYTIARLSAAVRKIIETC